jgi:gliding motility-associated protein GldC
MANSKYEIKFDIELDDNKIPEKMHWTAKDGGIVNQETKAIMLSVWDAKSKESLRIDLWTKEMNVEEMNLFMFQTLATMADTFEKATGNKELSDEMRDFVHHFGHKANVFGPDHQH